MVAGYTAEERFGELMAALANERGKLRQAIADGQVALRRKLCAALGVPAEATAETLAAAFCADGAVPRPVCAPPPRPWRWAPPPTASASAILARWCEAPARRHEMFEAYFDVFLTDKDEVRKSLIGKKGVRQACCDAAATLAAEAERLKSFRDSRAAVVLVEATCALVRLGDALLRAYERAQAAQGRARLRRSRAQGARSAAPPGYRALGAVQARWRARPHPDRRSAGHQSRAMGDRRSTRRGILRRRRRARPSPHGVRRRRRQAIDLQLSARRPAGLSAHARHFEQRVTAAQQEWRVLPLDISFRSTEPVLQAVDAIFRPEAARDGVALDGDADPPLWPPASVRPAWSSCGRRCRRRRRSPPIRWRCRSPASAPAEPHTRLARAIAATIKGWLDTGERLEARDRPIRPGDIMVLVRRRNAFVGELLRRAEGARRAGRRRRSPDPDRAAGGPGPGRARPVPAAARGRSDPGDGAEGPALRHRRGGAVRSRLSARRRCGCGAGCALRAGNAELRRAGERSDRLARPRRFRPALRALCRDPRRRGRAARLPRAARTRGGGSRRGIPRPGPRLRARACAVAAGLSALARRRRHRGQARSRRPAGATRCAS